MRDPTTRILTFARWVRTLLALRGAAVLLGFVVGLCALSLIVDLWLRLEVGARVWLAHLMVATWLVVLWRRVVQPQLGRWSGLDVAQATDHALGSPGWITRRYASALQYSTGAGVDSAGSRELIRVAHRRAVDELEEFRLRDRIDWKRAARSTTIVIALLGAPALTAALRPADAGLWFERWFLGSDARWPQDTWLEIEGIRDGQLVVPRGEPHGVRVRARAESLVPESVEATYEIDNGGRVTTTLSRYADNDFRLTLPPVSRTGEIRFRGNDDKQGPFLIVPRDRPRISEFRLTARLPGRDPVTTIFKSQDRDIGFKAKTEVALEVAVSEDVVRMDVIADDASSLAPTRIDARTWSLGWTHEATRSFGIEVVSSETGLRSHAYALDFALEDDRPPRVTLRVVGVRARVTPVARIPSRILAEDDGGLVRADLGVTVRPAPNATSSARSRTDVLHGPDEHGEERQVEVEHEVRLSDLGAVPGETIELVSTATDRCHLGPQIGRSRTRVLRVVRPEILYRDIALRLQRSRAKFRKGLNTAGETSDLLASEPDPAAWPTILRRHRIVERTVWSARRSLRENLQELVLNGLVERQAERLVEATVLEPLDNLYDRMLKDQRSGIEQRLDGRSDPRTGDLHGRQKGVVAQMDRILKSMRQWDSFVDLVNQLDEVIELQTGVRKETQGSGAKKKDGDEERKDE